MNILGFLLSAFAILLIYIIYSNDDYVDLAPEEEEKANLEKSVFIPTDKPVYTKEYVEEQLASVSKKKKVAKVPVVEFEPATTVTKKPRVRKPKIKKEK